MRKQRYEKSLSKSHKPICLILTCGKWTGQSQCGQHKGDFKESVEIAVLEDAFTSVEVKLPFVDL